MPSLNSTIDLDVKKFFRWWLRELDFLVPEKIRQLVNEKQGFIIVRPENNQLALTYMLNEQAEPLAILERNASGIEQYKALRAKDERVAKANLILRLTGTEAIQKELALPIAVKENLSQVVAYELDRYTPFKAEQVYFAVKLLEGEHEPGQIRVMLVLTPRETLDALYEDIKTMDMSPLFVDYEAAPNDLGQRYDGYNLLPENLREKPANAQRLIYTGLIAAIFLLLGAVLVLPVWFEYQTINTLQEKIDTIEKDAKEVKALQLEVDSIIDETRLLIAEKNAVPTLVDMLNTLSTLIKDDTWLSYAQYSDGHLQLQGESPAASALIGVLEDSKLFANARFVSPVTQDRISGQERFQITVDVIPTVEPSSVPSKQGGANGQDR
ncbi:MAG: PilN domain-containing protein [Methylobacter sp.]|nr:PilN domain-containing protein [Methylobacter sp.]